MKINILGFILLLSSLLFASFSKTGNIVTDSNTSLQWQDDSNANSNPKTWTVAVDDCNSLTLDSLSDWRLPNKKELMSIVDFSIDNPAIDGNFTNTISDNYWTSTTYSADINDSFYVNFNIGSVSSNKKTQSMYVRCVR